MRFEQFGQKATKGSAFAFKVRIAGYRLRRLRGRTRKQFDVLGILHHDGAL